VPRSASSRATRRSSQGLPVTSRPRNQTARPVARADWKVTRNIVISGKIPRREAPMLSKVRGLPSKT
jgi:hypothetical protein